MIFKLSIDQLFKVIQLYSRDSNYLLKEYWYSQLISKLQFNEPYLLAERLDVNRKINFFIFDLTIT